MLLNINEQSSSYQKFVDCVLRGASLQDIYVDSNHGYAGRQKTDTDNPVLMEKRQRLAKKEFYRVVEHTANLVDPIEKCYGIEGKKILEFGCGTGSLSIALALKGAIVTGVDPTAVSLEACKYRAEYFGIKEDAFQPMLVGTKPGLPFQNCSFDIVITNSVLEFIPFQREEYISDLLRLIKPGGIFVVSTENGLFPIDYYTGQWFPLFRRRNAIAKNHPYGLTYFELLRWINNAEIDVINASKNNDFNSCTKLVQRMKKAGNNRKVYIIESLNNILSRLCRLVGVPSDIFMRYATYIFVVKEKCK